MRSWCVHVWPVRLKNHSKAPPPTKLDSSSFMSDRSVWGALPAVIAVRTPVRSLLTVSPPVSQQRAAVNGSVRTLRTPVRLFTWGHTQPPHTFWLASPQVTPQLTGNISTAALAKSFENGTNINPTSLLPEFFCVFFFFSSLQILHNVLGIIKNFQGGSVGIKKASGSQLIDNLDLNPGEV